LADYVDTGFSGAAASRPQLDRLLSDARLRKFEAVLVWKLDRWGRSVAHCVRSIQELVGLGIRFLSPTESIDTGADSPMSKFLMHCSPPSRRWNGGLSGSAFVPGYARPRPEERP